MILASIRLEQKKSYVSKNYVHTGKVTLCAEHAFALMCEWE